MRIERVFIACVAASVATLLTSTSILAQTVSGVPGAPGATINIDGKQLPPPPQNFSGVIQPNAKESKPWWPARVVPPKGAPNVLLIMLDDVGFGATGTFGGVIPTPTLEQIAANGLRYTEFHTTALCSPTRAALLTGRNHHSVGNGTITELATGYPGYDSILPKDKATIAEIFKQHGYATAMFGKDHNTPEWQASQAGPFDQWPTGIGFEYFYGFIGGDTSQWQPNLYRNTSPIEPYLGQKGWNLTTAMADDAIQYLRQLNEITPNKPFFVYYAPGATHAPHHPTPEWIARFKGKFDTGWDALRAQIFANQQKLGVLPSGAKLSDWPDTLPHWDGLTPAQKKLFAREAEIYAAYLAYVDDEIGRVVREVGHEGKLDDTLIIYIAGDNGASPEGGLNGTPNEMASANGVLLPVEQAMKYYNAWGSDQTYPHMAVPWTWMFDTPYRWTKQIASYFGGTRVGMVMSWPHRIKDTGGIRSQFHHVIDIAPTLLEATGIHAPQSVNGIKQAPIEGVSMAYTWDKQNAAAPSRHHSQYFEMLGTRAMYQDGWIASVPPAAPPWLLTAKQPDDVMNGYHWELYDLSKDATQMVDLSAQYPAKLKSLQNQFMAAAVKYQVLPLDNTTLQRFMVPRPSLTAGRSHFHYVGELTHLPHGDAPSILDRSFILKADVEIPAGGAEGMLVTQGGRFGGYGFYLLKGVPVFTHNLAGLMRLRWAGTAPLTPGKHSVVFDFTYDGPGLGRGGTGRLLVDGVEVAKHAVPHTTPIMFQWDEDFDVGGDTGTPVDDRDYQVPFRFTGTLAGLDIDLKPLQLAPTDQNRLRQEGGRDNKLSQ
jgi:arylsulfatase A-like enzyme